MRRNRLVHPEEIHSRIIFFVNIYTCPVCRHGWAIWRVTSMAWAGHWVFPGFMFMVGMSIPGVGLSWFFLWTLPNVKER